MKKRVCPNCGNEIEDGEKFCNNCGTPIPEKEKHNFKTIGIVVACILVVVVGIGMLNSGNVNDDEFNGIENIKVSELVKIVKEKKKLEQYTKKNIRTKGYLFRKDDEIEPDKKITEVDYVISSSAESFNNNEYIMIKSDNVGKLKNVGSLSKLTVEGTLEKNKSGVILFKVDKVLVNKKLSKEEGKKTLCKELGLEEETDKTKTDSPNDDNSVKDGDTITVDDLLSNPAKYAGKTLKVHGMFPQTLLRTSGGRDIVTINNFNLDKYAEIKGGSPNFGGCEGIVTGNIILDNGTPIINASSFESIGSTLSADTSDAYYPITDGYTGYTTTYIANYNMAIRSDYSSSASKVDTLKKGQYVEIRDSKSTGQDIWGLIQPGKWVCIEDWSDGEIQYLTAVNGD